MRYGRNEEQIKQAILDYISRHGEASYSDLVEDLDLDPMTVMRICAELEKEGLIE